MPGITIDDLPLYDDSNVDPEEIVFEIEQKTITPETERSRKISLADLIKEGAEDISAGDGLLSDDGVIKVDNTVVRTSREIIAGDGLTGGGDLTENRTLSINVGVTAGDGLSGGGTLTQTRTIDVDNTVVRTSGNQTIDGTKTFSSTISGSINGNAATATTLQTARNINGVSFNGSANITLPTVNTSGDQTSITGIKTFSTQIRIPTSTPASLGNGAIWVV